MSENGKNSWLSSPASVIVILTVLLNAMGFLTVRTFIVRMCLPTNFFENTPIDYLEWGVRALVALVVLIIIVTLVVAFVAMIGAMLSFFIRQTVFKFTSVKELFERLILGLRTRAQGISVSMLTGILFIISFVIFIFYLITQAPVLKEFLGSPDCQSVPTVFSDSNKTQLNNYQSFSAILIFIISLSIFLSIRIRKRANGRKIFPTIFTFAIFSLWAIVLAFWAMPYRLISHNEFEEVNYDSSRVYVISEKDSRLFLYLPGERPFIIQKNDTLLKRNRKSYYENIFNNQKKAK